MTDQAKLEVFQNRITACTLCAAALPLSPRPVVRLNSEARLLIIGQAPGTKVHETGVPWNDPSGDRLRDWLGIDHETFYTTPHIALMPMGFCYPGRAISKNGKSGGDNPPRVECAPAWHEGALALMPAVELTLLVGMHAQKYYLGGRQKKSMPATISVPPLGTMTETVAQWRTFLPHYLPTPHPSWRTTGWLAKNPWFDSDVVPFLRQRVSELVT